VKNNIAIEAPKNIPLVCGDIGKKPLVPWPATTSSTRINSTAIPAIASISEILFPLLTCWWVFCIYHHSIGANQFSTSGNQNDIIGFVYQKLSKLWRGTTTTGRKGMYG
jgi:hypothetical protein